MRFKDVAVTLAIILAAPLACAAPPFLVRDLETRSFNRSSLIANGGSTSLVAVGDRVIFWGDDGRAGTELWSTDGTTAGTFRLTDARVGSLHSPHFQSLVSAGGRVFAALLDESSDFRVWVSDGTPDGTYGLPGFWPADRLRIIGPLVASGQHAFFSGGGVSTGTELCVADDLAVRVVTDLNPSYSSDPQGITSIGDGRVIFTANVPPLGRELWVSDGTAAGTRIVADLVPGSSSSNLTILGQSAGIVYFSFDRLLWRTDGTAEGTRQVRTAAGQSVADPKGIAQASNFAIVDAVAGLFHVSASQPAATLLVPASSGGCTTRPSPRVAEIAGVLIFTCSNWQHIWRSDGTIAGTFSLNSALPGAAIIDSLTQGQTVAYGFATINGRARLFRTDGTLAGTQLIETPLALSMFTQSQTCAIGDRLYFVGSDAEAGQELWVTDGTLATTRRATDIHGAFGGSSPESFASLGGQTFFRASSGAGLEPWITDGTFAGTSMVDDLNPGFEWSRPSPVGVIANKLLFFAGTPAAGFEPWVISDLSPLPNALGDFAPGVANSHGADGPVPPTPYPSAALGGNRVLPMKTPATGVELWVTDGSQVGTQLIADLNPGAGSSYPVNFVTTSDDVLVYFQAAVPPAGYELWRTDGTALGTRRAASNTGDLRYAGPPFEFNGQVVVPLLSGTSIDLYAVIDNQYQLWVQLPAGTWFGRVLRAGDDWLLYSTSGSTVGDRLWILHADSNEPTELLLSPALRQIRGTVTSDNTTYFIVWSSPESGRLWRTDGTPAGTRPIPTPLTGSLPMHARHLVSLHDGRIAFSAWTPEHGYEPWVSDGTAAGTRRLGDLSVGPESSWPEGLYFDGQRVLFSADEHNTIGRELYAWVVTATCNCDMTGDDAVSVQDLFGFLGIYFTGEADFDDNGETGISDIFAFLACWYRGCP